MEITPPAPFGLLNVYLSYDLLLQYFPLRQWILTKICYYLDTVNIIFFMLTNALFYFTLNLFISSVCNL